MQQRLNITLLTCKYVWQRKLFKFKIFITKGQVNKDLKTGPLSQNRIIHGITIFRHAHLPLLEDLAPIFWIS